jgi:hypothetical protein
VEEAEAAATRFVHVLAKLQSMETGFDLDIERLVGEVSQQVRANDANARTA